MVDQDGKLLDLHGEELTIRFHLNMYVQYEVNISENQVNTLKDTIRLKKTVILCFQKGGDVLLLTPAQINRLDKAQVEGRHAQIRMSARQMAKNVSYIRDFIGMLASLAAHVLPIILTELTTDLL